MESNAGFGKTDKVEEPLKSALDTQLELKTQRCPKPPYFSAGIKRKRRDKKEKPHTPSRTVTASQDFGIPFAYLQFLVFTSTDKKSLIKMWC